MAAEVIDYMQYLPDVFMMKTVQYKSTRVHIYLRSFSFLFLFLLFLMCSWVGFNSVSAFSSNHCENHE